MAADMDVKQRYFPHTQDELKEIASDILRYAKDSARPMPPPKSPKAMACR